MNIFAVITSNHHKRGSRSWKQVRVLRKAVAVFYRVSADDPLESVLKLRFWEGSGKP